MGKMFFVFVFPLMIEFLCHICDTRHFLIFSLSECNSVLSISLFEEAFFSKNPHQWKKLHKLYFTEKTMVY